MLAAVIAMAQCMVHGLTAGGIAHGAAMAATGQNLCVGHGQNLSYYIRRQHNASLPLTPTLPNSLPKHL